MPFSWENDDWYVGHTARWTKLGELGWYFSGTGDRTEQRVVRMLHDAQPIRAEFHLLLDGTPEQIHTQLLEACERWAAANPSPSSQGTMPGTMYLEATYHEGTRKVASRYQANGLVFEAGLVALEKIREQIAWEIDYAKNHCPAHQPKPTAP